MFFPEIIFSDPGVECSEDSERHDGVVDIYLLFTFSLDMNIQKLIDRFLTTVMPNDPEYRCAKQLWSTHSTNVILESLPFEFFQSATTALYMLSVSTSQVGS